MAKLSRIERQRGMTLLMRGATAREVSGLLYKSNGEHPSVRGVRKMWKVFRDDPFKNTSLSKIGRPSKLSKRDRCRILWMLDQSKSSNSECSSNYIREHLFLDASDRTIRRFLNAQGYFWKRPARKHSYTSKELRARVTFAKQHRHLSSTDWMNTVFSDEVSFFWRTGRNALRAQMCRRRGVYRRKGESLSNGLTQPGRSSVRNGRLLKVICAMYNGEIVYFYAIPGKLNGAEYSVYLDNLANILQNIYGVHEFRLLHDNVPLHNTPKCLEVIAQRKIELVRIPPLSPDLNPIENVFSFVRDKVEKAPPCASYLDFRRGVRMSFEELPSDTLIKLAGSMPTRLRALLSHRGGPIKW